jgi:hypothetical protein
MKVIKMTGRLVAEEKETILNYSYIDKKWYMTSFVQKHFNRALKQGWTVLVKYEYDDGTAAGYEFEAPARAITIRNTEKKQMSERQMNNLVVDEDDED